MKKGDIFIFLIGLPIHKNAQLLKDGLCLLIGNIIREFFFFLINLGDCQINEPCGDVCIFTV